MGYTTLFQLAKRFWGKYHPIQQVCFNEKSLLVKGSFDQFRVLSSLYSQLAINRKRVSSINAITTFNFSNPCQLVNLLTRQLVNLLTRQLVNLQTNLHT